MNKAEKKMTTCATNEVESIFRRKVLNGVVEKINNEKNKLVVDLWKTSQNYEVITDHKRN